MTRAGPADHAAAEPRPPPPLVTRHDTWVSLDPVLGCPASCSYCYLHTFGLTARRPHPRASIHEALSALERHFERPEDREWGGAAPWPVPVCIGNYTDLLMTELGRTFLAGYLALHAERFPVHPLVTVTKARLQAEFLARLDAVGHPLLVFLSQSFAKQCGFPGVERGPIATTADTARNAELLAATRNLRPLHFWRPITTATVPDLERACRLLRPLRDAGVVASVAIGLKGGPFLQAREEDNQALLCGEPVPLGGEWLPQATEERVLEAGRLLGHPVYRRTSCAVALALGRAEALSTWRTGTRAGLCEPCSCPRPQRARCDRARAADRPPASAALADLAEDLDLDPVQVCWDPAARTVCIDAELDQELHTLISHRLGAQVIPLRIRQTRAWIGSIGEPPRPAAPSRG